MAKNIRTKIVVILALLAIFVFGIFGVPHGITPSALKAAITNRINLGLDLRGGTHLVLQVNVAEAVGTTTDSDAARIQTELQTAGITVGSITKPDPKHPEVIQIQGTPTDRVGDVRTTLNNRYGTQYEIALADSRNLDADYEGAGSEGPRAAHP